MYQDELEEIQCMEDDAALQREVDADPRPFGTRDDWRNLVITCPGCGQPQLYKGIMHHLLDDDGMTLDQAEEALARIPLPYK